VDIFSGVLAVIRFYDVAVFIHVAAVVVGLGVTFSYPVFLRRAANLYPRGLPYVLTAIDRMGKAVIGPSAVLILVSGLYLVGDGPWDFSDTFVSVGLPIIIVLILVGPLFFGRKGSQLERSVSRDLEGTASGEDRLGDESNALLRQILTVGYASDLLVLVALFFMIVKP
jgi:predicted integral membrane protein DUF2269